MHDHDHARIHACFFYVVSYFELQLHAVKTMVLTKQTNCRNGPVRACKCLIKKNPLITEVSMMDPWVKKAQTACQADARKEVAAEMEGATAVAFVIDASDVDVDASDAVAGTDADAAVENGSMVVDALGARTDERTSAVNEVLAWEHWHTMLLPRLLPGWQTTVAPALETLWQGAKRVQEWLGWVLAVEVPHGLRWQHRHWQCWACCASMRVLGRAPPPSP
jgi:hypothetical protein